jgi:TetR/AcrR family transcriptional repressor of nem operon
MAKEQTREKLISAAGQIFYAQGVHRTTLADIAAAAAVPLGNVYYHFRTKGALVEAVISARAQELTDELRHYEQFADPRQRLQALAMGSQGSETQLARYGCPYATLSQEIEKDVEPLGIQAGALLRSYVDWAEGQFQLMGLGDAAHELAIELIARIQGTFLLVYAFRSPELLAPQRQHIVAWLDQLG